MPAPEAGVIGEVKVKVGDKVSKGALLAVFAQGGAAAAAAPAVEKPAAPAAAAKVDFECDVVVLGAGPGGYTAAFRAADLGKNVVLIDRRPTLGGVCLNVGCIPSKALLHAAKVIDEASEMSGRGVAFGPPRVDLDALRGWKEGVVKRLTTGLAGLARQRKVSVVTGEGAFTSPHTLAVATADGERLIRFTAAIVAAGSEPAAPGFIPRDPRVWDSTDALELKSTPKRLLILGGGVIGLEMATVYHALGSKITVIELMDQLMPGADRDIVAPFAKRVEKRYEKILLETKVTAVEARPDGLHVAFEGKGGAGKRRLRRDAGLGRAPPQRRQRSAPRRRGSRSTRAASSPSTSRCAPTCPIFSPSATSWGSRCSRTRPRTKARSRPRRRAATSSAFDAKAIPAVAYTDPEVAWVGVTESEAKAKGLAFGKAVFPGRRAGARCRSAATRA